jgi:putative FmdB family regulatory protein
MPNYCFKCLECGESAEAFRPMRDFDLPEICKCGKQMSRDLITEHSAVRSGYNKPIVSDSMAFDAIDLTEHRRQFPDIEVVVDHARSARPVFKSLSQKRKYLKARGFVDCNSFTG